MSSTNELVINGILYSYTTENHINLSFHNSLGELIAIIDPVDRSAIFPDFTREGSRELCEGLGAKRFILNGEPTVTADGEYTKDPIHFRRDKVLKLDVEAKIDPTHATAYTVHAGPKAFKTLEDTYGRALYTEKLLTLSGQSNFSGPKKVEAKEQAAAGQYCRFNGKNIHPVLLTDASGQIIASIRILMDKEKNFAYLSDEIISGNLTKDGESITETSPAYHALLATLFNEAKKYIASKNAEAVTLIRVAGNNDAEDGSTPFDRERMYIESLGGETGISSQQAYVVHGSPTDTHKTLERDTLESGLKLMVMVPVKDNSPEDAIATTASATEGHGAGAAAAEPTD